MITKREKLQYIYVFLTDLVVLLLSTLLAWLVTDGLLKQLVPYAPSDWVQTICLLMLAFVATFICFDQTENIVTRTSGEEKPFDFSVTDDRFQTREVHCGKCANQCEIICVYRGEHLIDAWGNRCEKGAMKLA